MLRDNKSYTFQGSTSSIRELDEDVKELEKSGGGGGVGPQGPKGDPGPQGPKGDKGDPGDTNSQLIEQFPTSYTKQLDTVTVLSENVVHVDNHKQYGGVKITIPVISNESIVIFFDIRNMAYGGSSNTIFQFLLQKSGLSSKQMHNLNGLSKGPIDAIGPLSNPTRNLSAYWEWAEIADYVTNNTLTILINSPTTESLSYDISCKTYTLLGSGTLKNKKVIFMGDSITTFTYQWVKDFIFLTKCNYIANTAVSNAVLEDDENTVITGEAPTAANHNNTLHNQVQMIINNQYETPDVIIISIGTNGALGTIDKNNIDESYSKEIGSLDTTNMSDAFRYCINKLREIYPNVEIFWCNPIQRADRTYPATQKIADNLAILTSYSSIHNIETNRCGIDSANEIQGSVWKYLADGLHPHSHGSWLIASYNAKAISEWVL